MLQLVWQSVPEYLNMTYNYSATANNGRITSSVDGITGENTAYSYDALNRLTGASNGLWSEQYTYDGFGNLTTKTGSNGAPSMTATYDAGNHQTGSGIGSDANGNQWSNTAFNTFTVENRIVRQYSEVWPGAEVAYSYDPWGKRVMTFGDPDPNNDEGESNPIWQYHFYGITGQRLATVECVPSGDPTYGAFPYCTISGQNVYFGKKLLVSNGVTVVTDRLGSVRANTQGEQMAYYP
jgi:YD repeat-containing protein